MIETVVTLWYLTFYCTDPKGDQWCIFYNNKDEGHFYEEGCVYWAEDLAQILFDNHGIKIEYSCIEKPVVHPHGMYVPKRRY